MTFKSCENIGLWGQPRACEAVPCDCLERRIADGRVELDIPPALVRDRTTNKAPFMVGRYKADYSPLPNPVPDDPALAELYARSTPIPVTNPPETPPCWVPPWASKS